MTATYLEPFSSLTKKFAVVIGTRPEAIKQIPLYWALQRVFGESSVALVSTGQHRDLLKQTLNYFHVEPTHELNLMVPGQSLNPLAASVLTSFDVWLKKEKPDWVIVQGDTTTAAMAAIASFHSKIKVAHNEAGLRSYDLNHPFPEEANRSWISTISACNFAPTERAKAALIREGISPQRIFITGNTGIDALFWILSQPPPTSIHEILSKCLQESLRPILLTAHRRESQGQALKDWFYALRKFLEIHPDLFLIYPSHPNDLALKAFEEFLSDFPRALRCAPLDYGSLCHLLNESYFVITDSGGIQEEAATLGVPTVICRQTTERMEAVEDGIAQLAGYSPQTILKCMHWAEEKSRQPRVRRNLFGDGQSAQKIAEILRGDFH